MGWSRGPSGWEVFLASYSLQEVWMPWEILPRIMNHDPIRFTQVFGGDHEIRSFVTPVGAKQQAACTCDQYDASDAPNGWLDALAEVQGIPFVNVVRPTVGPVLGEAGGEIDRGRPRRSCSSQASQTSAQERHRASQPQATAMGLPVGRCCTGQSSIPSGSAPIQTSCRRSSGPASRAAALAYHWCAAGLRR